MATARRKLCDLRVTGPFKPLRTLRGLGHSRYDLTMEEEPVLREALSRRDAALAEARRLDEFVRLYNELRGIKRDSGLGKYGEVTGNAPAPLSVVSDGTKNGGEPMSGEFILDKTRPLSR